MINSTKGIQSFGYIDSMDRAFRIIMGLAILCIAMEITNQTGVAYPITSMIAATIVLTGIAEWDPFVACYRALRKYFAG